MKIATWNVNGIRARQAQFLEWIERDAPDVVCLQELKAAPDQVPASIVELPGYWNRWHGAPGGYSGVSLHIRRDMVPQKPAFEHPALDFENRIVVASIGKIKVASVYVPNGGKDYCAKLGFLKELARFAAAVHAEGEQLILCGDINVARTDQDVFPGDRKPVIGQRPDERALFEALLGQGLVDIARTLHPDDNEMFTWWAPWRNMRQRNLGWRIDYVLASAGLAQHATECTVLRHVGTSDHAPVVASFNLPGENK